MFKSADLVPAMPAASARRAQLERNVRTIQDRRRRVLLAAIAAGDARLASAALAELGALMGAW